ncbi:uncharacterized protein LOC108144529 [Drosophila elegans]|uniref:uncharacterized protein LOC108144529 n=1 Tax=Drosophila elegans TaxID=30023 RepID=UPI0007E8B07F|nr:uncharacterized protein LOC108144529 [Drosophila elegans]
MPDQYTNYRFTRVVMVLLRCSWALFYLWVMIHAAAILPVPVERWTPGFWSSKRYYVLTYKSLIDFNIKTELCIHILANVLMFCLFRCCSCSFLGPRYLVGKVNKPHMNYGLLVFKAPYLIAFLVCWVVSTAITVLGVKLVAKQDQSDSTYILYGQFAIALLFKLLILANFYSVCLKTWAYLKIFEAESNAGLITYQNFGDHLSLLFRV